MNLSDELELLVIESGYDDNLDPVEESRWVPIGKCCIIQNSSASKVRTNDGTEYVYSYVIVYRHRKGALIPHEGDTIHITKKDGTIDKECKVVGFVTLRNWVKVWV